MKKIVFVMLLLSIILLWYQWMMYAEDRDETDEEKPLLVVNIVERENRMDVEQKISHLTSGEYQLILPKGAEKFSCSILDDASCDIDGDTLTVDESHDDVSLSFQLPKDDVDLLYFIDPIILLKDINADVKLTLSSRFIEDGGWVGSKSPFFSEQLTNINYVEWEFHSSEPVVLAKINHDYVFNREIGQVQLYSTAPIDIEDFSFIEPFKEEPHLMLISSQNEQLTERGISVIHHLEKRKIAHSLFKSHLLTFKQSDEKPLIDAIASYFYNIEVNEQLQQITNALSNGLNETEKETWFELLLGWEDKTTDLITVLDRTLQKATGLNTFFFSHYVNQESISPIYGFDDRPIIINGETEEVEWKNIIYQNDHYIPIAGLADLLGFNMLGLNEGNEIFIEFEANRYRFFTEGELFIINEENYRLQENAIVKINGEVYIKTMLASDIFPVHMILSEDSLEINIE